MTRKTYVDTQFRTNNLTLEDEQKNHSMYPKIKIALHILNHSSHNIVNDLEILMIVTICWFPNQTVRLKDITRSSFTIYTHSFGWN